MPRSPDSSGPSSACSPNLRRLIIRPHLHAYYQDDVGIFAIDTVELIGGELPQRQRRLVEAWAEIHHAELRTAWERLQAGRPPGKIEPLR